MISISREARDEKREIRGRQEARQEARRIHGKCRKSCIEKFYTQREKLRFS